MKLFDKSKLKRDKESVCEGEVKRNRQRERVFDALKMLEKMEMEKNNNKTMQQQ